jgi:hypothetical protein
MCSEGFLVFICCIKVRISISYSSRETSYTRVVGNRYQLTNQAVVEAIGESDLPGRGLSIECILECEHVNRPT